MNEKKNEIMTKVEALLGDYTITLFRDPSQQDDGAIYFTAHEGADVLRLDDYRAFLRLVRAHRDELVEGEEIVVPSATIGAKGRDTKLFRITVLDLLAPLTKKTAGKMIRRWTADIRQRFRRGESAEITRAQFDALKIERDEWKARALASEAAVRAIELTVARLTGRVEQMAIVLDSRASDSARSLNEYRRLPEISAIAHDRKRREAEERSGHRQPSFFNEGPGAFAMLKDKLLESMRAEVASGAPLKYRKHALAKLVKAPHRQAVAAVESLLASGVIGVDLGNVVIAKAVVPATAP